MHLHTSWQEAEEEEETPEILRDPWSFWGRERYPSLYQGLSGEPQLANNLHPGKLEASGANGALQSACTVSGKCLVSRSIWDRSPFTLTESLLKSGPNYLLTATWLHDILWQSPLFADNKATHPCTSSKLGPLFVFPLRLQTYLS